MKPEVSVIIPTHNRPELLSRAIRSVLRQTFDGLIEILVIDDSLDFSMKNKNSMIVDQFDSDNIKIKYITNQFKKGLSGARNTGIANAQSGLIAILDDDDEFILPNKLQDQYNAFQNNSGLGFCGHDLLLHNTINGSTYTISYPQTHEEIQRFLPISCPIWGSSLMFKKDVAQALGGYKYIGLCEDYDFLLRMCKSYEGISLPKAYSNYNVSGDSMSHNISYRTQIAGLLVLMKSGYGYTNYFPGIIHQCKGLNPFKRNRKKVGKLILSL